MHLEKTPDCFQNMSRSETNPNITGPYPSTDSKITPQLKLKHSPDCLKAVAQENHSTATVGSETKSLASQLQTETAQTELLISLAGILASPEAEAILISRVSGNHPVKKQSAKEQTLGGYFAEEQSDGHGNLWPE